MAVCDIDGCEQHYGCRLRSKGVAVSPRATPTKNLNWRPSKQTPPGRYKQIIYEDRPGGAKIPVMKSDGEVLRGKEYDENRNKIDKTIRTIRNSGHATQE